MTSRRYRSGSAFAALFILTFLSCKETLGPNPNPTPDPNDPDPDVSVSRVVVTPATVTLTRIGASQQFQAQARDASGNAVSGTSFTWTSSNPAVATVDADGVATARAEGWAYAWKAQRILVDPLQNQTDYMVLGRDASPSRSQLGLDRPRGYGQGERRVGHASGR